MFDVLRPPVLIKNGYTHTIMIGEGRGVGVTEPC